MQMNTIKRHTTPSKKRAPMPFFLPSRAIHNFRFPCFVVRFHKIIQVGEEAFVEEEKGAMRHAKQCVQMNQSDIVRIETANFY